MKKNTMFHVLFWCCLIVWEVPIAGIITGIWGNFWDYALHYCLYISIFYFHAHVCLKKSKGRFGMAAMSILGEFLFIYAAGVAIYFLLHAFGVRTIVEDPFGLKFLTGSAYRLSFMLILSTGYWHLLSQLWAERQVGLQAQALLKKEVENEKLRADTIQAQLAKLKTVINPHFLFNTLNALFFQLRKERPTEAAYLLDLSDMMSYNLSPVNGRSKIHLWQEIHYLTSYLKLMELQGPHALELNIDIPTKDSDELMIVPLIIPTFLENIFQHAELSDFSDPATMDIKVQRNHLAVRIDNAIRHRRGLGHGLGLQNTLQRLGHFYPGAFRYDFHQEQGHYHQELSIIL